MTQAIFSAYPITKQLVEQIERATGVEFDTRASFGELRRQSALAIIRTLRRVRAEAAWIAVSDHNYQPHLPLLLLLGAMTRAHRLKVVAFDGESYETSRWRVFLIEPLRLALGSIQGFWALAQAYWQCRRLLVKSRLSCSLATQRPRMAYLKTNLWFGVQAGGSIGHVAGVANGFSRLGCEVDMYAVERLPLLDSAINEVRIRGTGAVGLPLDVGKFSFQRLFVEQSAASMRMRPPQAIYQRNCLANFAGVVLSRRYRVPLVIEYNGSEVWISEHWGVPLKFAPILKMVEGVNLRHAHLIVVVSDVLKQELMERGIPSSRIVSYPNCVDPRVFEPGRFSSQDIDELRAEWGIDHSAVLCMFIGTFGQWHGIDVLAQAIRKLSETENGWLRKRNVHFMLVGDGPLMPKVREIVGETARDFVTFTGLVQQDQAPRFLAAADVLLSPHVSNADGSRFFGSPTKLFEYMAMCKGIVASDLEQIGEVLNPALHVDSLPDTGPDDKENRLAVLTPPGDVDRLVEAVRFLVERPDWRSVLGDNARKEALARYTWDHHVQAILNGLHSVAGQEPIGDSSERTVRPGKPGREMRGTKLSEQRK